MSQLKLAGFGNDDICALLPDKTGAKDFAFERHTKAPEGAALGGLIGGLACAGLGGLFGWGVLSVAILKPLAAAGPALGALSGAAVGMVLGAGVGSLAGLARPEYEAKRYEGKVREGGILISVHCEQRAGARRARQIFRKAGACGIGTSQESDVPTRGKETPFPAAASVEAASSV